ncbi:MAG: c-type cytochrome, partial [Deltaproteobacteria bacterium]|nr:c-type cytochrome [Deltaproteobacteria bacterium]
PAAEPAPVVAAKPDPAALKAGALAKETVAFEAAKPVFEKHCASCHKKGSRNASAKKLEELEITAYPFTGEHANAKDIREVLAIGGGKATMPKNKPGSVKGDDLAAIAAWADAWDAAETAGAHAK